MSDYNLTINLYADSAIDTSSWAIRQREDEPERISVRKGNKEYSIVFSNPVRFEVWSSDNNGELGERQQVCTSIPDEPIFPPNVLI